MSVENMKTAFHEQLENVLPLKSLNNSNEIIWEKKE